jgi:hypothetical protein
MTIHDPVAFVLALIALTLSIAGIIVDHYKD